MPPSPAAPPPPAAAEPPSPPDRPAQPDAWAIWYLAVGQTLGYAALLYIFAALLVAWEGALGWSKAQLALGPTLAILVSAAVAPLAGRLVDRGLGAELLWGGALFGAAALVLLALVRSPAEFVAVWALIGLAHGACLYEVCFAFLVRRLGPAARPAIIRITLVAGFASTIAFPAGAALATAVGWRGAVLAFAAALLLGAAPLNLAAGRRLRRGDPPRRPGADPARASADRAGRDAALRRPAFWLLAGLLGLIAANHAMLVSYFIPLFIDRGASPALAVLAASCVGPAQVAGRLVLMLGEARMGTWRASALMLGSLVLAALLLWAAGLATGLIFGFALCQGVAIGQMSILKPMLTAQTLGQAGFGAISGRLAVAPLLGGAAAPFAGALVLEAGGAVALILTCQAMALAAAATGAALYRAATRG